MKIGELANLSGVPVKSVRYYEEEGILPAPRRLENGYRDYSKTAVAELIFLRQSRQFGFTLKECRQLLQLWRDPNRRSAEVHQLVIQRQKQVEQQITDLTSMHELLSDLLSHCAADDSPECAIIDSLSEKDHE
ncbi:MerR family transcriptional regulator [Porticoccaceae bacterium]|nr:MerR family transcriptional regulator [Porticoccaceae bacterium]MDC0010137.1 MerR family transcriptional regulator [Porticoccaceae bacterium]MDC1512473.1 MerR family transcriptional regulator [Porticoccaceae bacterium]